MRRSRQIGLKRECPREEEREIHLSLIRGERAQGYDEISLNDKKGAEERIGKRAKQPCQC